uniref:RAB43, member RAS oncogene family n=1 Tax=Sinocyclocheilus grahami TaxID=75366 RepID=A0A672K5T2_SINGR
MSLRDSEDSYDLVFKIVLVGDVGVGKTCVLQRFKSGVFLERQSNTIGVDFTMKTLTSRGQRVKVSCSLACCSGFPVSLIAGRLLHCGDCYHC